MRPAISRLIRETIYPKLQDHVTVLVLPNVVGMRKNLFWLDHDHPEDSECSETHHKSHANAREASMVHALVRHMVRQGAYSSSDIAVLTPYTGQLQKLRTVMRNDFEVVLSERDQDALAKDGLDGTESNSEASSRESPPTQKKVALAKKQLSQLLRVATVDNFQGEEAKVIIVSLVRSNQARKVGFLKTTNRINVLLSRAQHGMYLIGNTETYMNVEMWQTVINIMRASDSVGSSLELCCPRHRDTPIKISEPEDFARYSPEGGCSQPCRWRLRDCGHMCQAKCHSESMHNIFSCPQPCQRLHEPCGHACGKPTCGEDCGKCLVLLTDVELPCGHFKDTVACHLAQQPESVRCQTIVEKVVPGCDHKVEVECSKSVTSAGYVCPVPCAMPLPCGHPCPGTCGKCGGRDNDLETTHQKCRKICGKPFSTCNHHCHAPCHGGTDCGLCVAFCDVKCQHSNCASKCSEACTPCVEACQWSCEHQGSCTMRCAAPCDRLPCDERCAKLLSCGHRCPGICGEICPDDLCRDCGRGQDARVDLLEMKTYAEIDVDLTPIVVLGCRHFFTAETLDGLVGMRTAYVSDAEGRFTALADMSTTLADKVPQCPDCQRPVRQYATRRYNRIINRAVADRSSKRFLVTGKAELNKVDIELENLQEELAASHAEFLRPMNMFHERLQALFEKQVLVRYTDCDKLRSRIKDLRRKTSERYQPSHKLYEATIHALRRKTPDGLSEALADLSVENKWQPVERDRRVALAGEMALLKLDFITLEDKMGISLALRSATSTQAFKWPGGSPHLLVKAFLKNCTSLISSCDAAALPKLAVEATLYHARMAQMYQSCHSLVGADIARAIEFVADAKNNLERASLLCEQPFQHVEILKEAVRETIQLLQRERYETVSPEEVAAIKRAMLAGSSGLPTHSGHWYNCANGHPVRFV